MSVESITKPVPNSIPNPPAASSEKAKRPPAVLLANMNSPDIFALFGKPPVLATENLAAYETLRGYAVAQVLPCDFLEYANLRRYVDLTWEALRYQRCAAAIINITCWDALNRLVRELAQDGIKGLTAD